ncbi:hypothetical protein Y032_0197g1589 [Ancylostoma ceylanicum]|uniref:Uncharacterized protein n=1 Tax=Ancylostoma ceylanicum TaxID=53326 RepID=A0A016SP87_9BILA|nr:hypothetical protein Y032_0197g1589 [Ancylostoma ceylanicum]
MKAGQRGMKFSVRRKCGRREAASACDCYATAISHVVARIQYKLPLCPAAILQPRRYEAARAICLSFQEGLYDIVSSIRSFDQKTLEWNRSEISNKPA